MKALVFFAMVFFVSCSVLGQKGNLVVRYEFADKSSPPVKVFYLRIYIDNLISDSTKPHKPISTGNLNFDNDAHLVVTEGCHEVKIEGVVKDKIDDAGKLVTVMTWTSQLKVDKDKARVKLKLNEQYNVVSETISESCKPEHKLMILDSTLQANSKKMPLKFKTGVSVGGNGMEKFKFGNYDVVKTKSEWDASLTNSKWFNKDQSKDPKKKNGFQVSCENNKSLDANLSIPVDEQGFVQNYLLLNDKSGLRKNELSAKDQLLPGYSALIHCSGDSSDWAMIFVSYFPENKIDELKKYGFLTNDSLLIEIAEVRAWEGDAQNKSMVPLGFEFYVDGRAIAAIQCPNDFFAEKYAWFRNDIEPSIKNIVAGAMVACYNYFGSSMKLY